MGKDAIQLSNNKIRTRRSPNFCVCEYAMGHYLPKCGNIIEHLGTCKACFAVRESGDECICGDTLISINVNTNDESSAYFSPVFFDCYKHLDELSSDVLYLNEINYFDNIDSSSVAKLTSAKQKMMNSSNSYFSAGDCDGSSFHECSKYKSTTSTFLCSAKTLGPKINGTLNSYERDTCHEFSCSNKPLACYATNCARTHGTS